MQVQDTTGMSKCETFDKSLLLHLPTEPWLRVMKVVSINVLDLFTATPLDRCLQS